MEDVTDEDIPETIGCRDLHIDSLESIRDSTRKATDRQVTLPGKNKLVDLNREGLNVTTSGMGLQVT